MSLSNIISPDGVHLECLVLNNEMSRLLVEWDEDTQRINFPVDSPNKEETLARIANELAADPEGMFVVMRQSVPVGCLMLVSRFNPYRRCRYVDWRNLYLVSEERGKGLGKRLVRFVLFWGAAHGCTYVSLGTSVDNVVALSLFESLGFTRKRVIFEKSVSSVMP